MVRCVHAEPTAGSAMAAADPGLPHTEPHGAADPDPHGRPRARAPRTDGRTGSGPGLPSIYTVRSACLQSIYTVCSRRTSCLYRPTSAPRPAPLRLAEIQTRPPPPRRTPPDASASPPPAARRPIPFGTATEMGRALDSGVVRNNLFAQWRAKVGSAAKAFGQAPVKDQGGAPHQGGAPEKDQGGAPHQGGAPEKDQGCPLGKDRGDPPIDSVSPGFLIPGLWSPQVARLNKLYEDANQSLVYLNMKMPSKSDLTVNQRWYLMSGRLTVKDLSDRVRYKVNLDVYCPLQFSVDGDVLSEDTSMTALLKKYASDDGYTYLNCDSAEDPLLYPWTVVVKKKKKRTKAKLASDSILMKNIEPIATPFQPTDLDGVPYLRWPSCKTKGKRKKSQYLKKKLMELAMHQRSSFIEPVEFYME